VYSSGGYSVYCLGDRSKCRDINIVRGIIHNSHMDKWVTGKNHLIAYLGQMVPLNTTRQREPITRAMVYAVLSLSYRSLRSFSLAFSHSSIVIFVSFCWTSLSLSLSAKTAADYGSHFIFDHHSPCIYVPHSSIITHPCCLLSAYLSVYVSLLLSLTCWLSVLLIVVCFCFL
jgi:hypothetical protein